MDSYASVAVDTEAVGAFAQAMGSNRIAEKLNVASRRLNLEHDDVKHGLGRLVLCLIKLLHELLERQAIRRIEAGSLSDQQVERLGLTLMKQAEELEHLRRESGLDDEDLNLDLGPLGRLFQ
ncbi:MAG: gas vesicle protein K [Acidobacteriota bacterium]